MSRSIYGTPRTYATHRGTARTQDSEAGRHRCCCAGCAAGSFLAALAFFGVVSGLALSQPQRSPEVEKRRQAAVSRWGEPPPSQPPAEVRALRDRVERAAEEAERSAPPGGTKRFTALVSEDELNSLLATDPRIRKELAAQGVKELTILFENGRVLVDALVDRGGLTLRASADGIPVVRSDGTVDVRIENARAGRFPIPSDAMAKVRGELAKALATQDPKHGKVTSLDIVRGRITISGEATGDLPDLTDR